MNVIINPNLLLWPGEKLSFAIPAQNFNHFIFIDFTENTFNLLKKFAEPISLESIKDPEEFNLITSIIIDGILIPFNQYEEELSRSIIWKGFRYIDFYVHTKKGLKFSTEKRKISAENIYIIDSFFDHYEHFALSFWSGSSSYKRNDIDNEESKYSRHWVNSLSDTEANCNYFPLFHRTDRLIRDTTQPLSLEIIEIKSYLTTYGDIAFYHQDSEDFDSITAIVYLHTEWDLNWNGELIICDEQWNPLHCIYPKPGRIVIFNGKLPHRGGVPTRICHEARKTLVFRYRVR